MPTTRFVLPAGRRRVRWVRMARAVWRDSLALWAEFRAPFITFLLATLGGGWLYGELHALAGHERIPYLDLPYIMLGLMVLDTSIDLPKEPYLIAFWYAMPAIFAYIVGRGVVDFVRLFFNRSERRSAWEEAVASTFRNHVIVIGVGHVGLRVVRHLTGMGFDVVGIEHKLSPEKEAELKRMGVPMIVGDGRQSSMLEKAGLRYAEALVICTADDHVNVETIMRARDLNPDIRIVARMWDNQYAAQLKRFMGVEAVLSASDLAAPAFAGAAVGIEITQTLRVQDVDYSMIRLHVSPGSFLEGDTVGSLQEAHEMDIVLHGRDGRVEVQPDNDMVVHGGDTLVIFARHDQVIRIVERNRRGANGSR